MKNIFFIMLGVILTIPSFSQDTEKKVEKKEKTVKVDVKKKDGDKRHISVTTIDDQGQEKLIEWSDDGEVPADVIKQLEEAGVDVQIMNGSDGDHEKMIIVDVDEVHSGKGDHNIWFSDDHKGDVKVITFDVEGEDGKLVHVKELLKEHDIDIEHDGDHDRVIRIKKKKGDGEHKNIEKKKYRIITKDGDDKVMEWIGDGLHEEHMDKDDNIEIHVSPDGRGKRGKMLFRGDNELFFTPEHSASVSNAYMGAQIGDHEEGAEILEIMKDGPADKAKLEKGDVVQKINGLNAKSADGLITLLGFLEPDDKVELTITRKGSKKTIKLTLGTRPDHYK